MSEKVTAKQRFYRSFSNIKDKLLAVLQNKKDYLKLSDENKIELKRDVKIYGLALVVSAVALALLNFLWWLFAKLDFGFLSPLNHQEGLQMIVDVTCSVVIAVATIRLEYRWRRQDIVKRNAEEKQHTQELVSDRIRELNSNDLRAIGYAVTNTSGFFCDFLHHYNEGIASADFVMAIVPSDSHKSLIPAHFNLVNESLKVNEFKICGVNCNDESQANNKKLHCYLFHDIFLIWTDFLLDNESRNALFEFLSNVLYIKQERERKTIKISFSVTLTELLSKDETSKDETSKDETSKDETSKDETSKDETSKDETSKDETSKDETSKDETSKDETSKDGTSKDGTSKDETSKDENVIQIPYKASLILYPVSSFTSRGTFDCQVIYN